MYLHGDIFVLSISIATTLMQRIQIGQSRMSVLVPNDIMLIHWRSSFLQLKIIIRMTQGSLISSYAFFNRGLNFHGGPYMFMEILLLNKVRPRKYTLYIYIKYMTHNIKYIRYFLDRSLSLDLLFPSWKIR